MTHRYVRHCFCFLVISTLYYIINYDKYKILLIWVEIYVTLDFSFVSSIISRHYYIT